MKTIVLFAVVCLAVVSAVRAAQPPVPDDALGELTDVEAGVALIECPIPFSEAKTKIEAIVSLEWICGVGENDETGSRSREEYAIVSPHLKGKGYLVVLESSGSRGHAELVTKILIGVRTPTGQLFFADPRDTGISLKYPKKEANKALVPTPASVTPAAGAPVAPDAGAAHL